MPNTDDLIRSAIVAAEQVLLEQNMMSPGQPDYTGNRQQNATIILLLNEILKKMAIIESNQSLFSPERP